MAKFSLKRFLDGIFFNEKWTCNSCGDEVFDEKYFCEKCYKKLPFNDGEICLHCGRATLQTEEYCLTCKNKLTHIEKGRSVFKYEGELPRLIQDFKYNNKRYLSKVFAKYLAKAYLKNYFNADYLVYVPMFIADEKKRRYNQTELLADELSIIVGVPVLKDNLIKAIKTNRQANLTGDERMENLSGAFKLTDKKLVKDKRLLIIDDVTTTGATAETLAKLLNESGAKEINLLTIASVTMKKQCGEKGS